MKKTIDFKMVDKIPQSELMYVVFKLFNCLNFLKEGTYSLKKMFETMICEIKNRLIYKYRYEYGKQVRQVRFSREEGFFIINKDKISINDLAKLYEDEWIKMLAETVYIGNQSCQLIDLFPLIILKEQKQEDMLDRVEYYKNNELYKCVERKIKVSKVKAKVNFNGTLITKDYLTEDEVAEIKHKCISSGANSPYYIIFNMINGKIFCLTLLGKNTSEIIEKSNPLIPIKEYEVIEFAVPCDWLAKLHNRCMVYLYKMPKIYCDEFFIRLTSKGVDVLDIPLYSMTIDEETKKKRKEEFKFCCDMNDNILFESKIIRFPNLSKPDANPDQEFERI